MFTWVVVFSLFGMDEELGRLVIESCDKAAFDAHLLLDTAAHRYVLSYAQVCTFWDVRTPLSQ